MQRKKIDRKILKVIKKLFSTDSISIKNQIKFAQTSQTFYLLIVKTIE